jgi:hypothetical protein
LEIKAQRDAQTTILGDIKTPLSIIDRSCRPKSQQGNFRIKWHYRSHGYNRPEIHLIEHTFLSVDIKQSSK